MFAKKGIRNRAVCSQALSLLLAFILLFGTFNAFAVAECSHTNKQELPMSTGYREIPGDDVYHSYITYYQTRCADCQEILVSQYEKTTKEKHDYGYFSQGIKRCSNCNHEAEVVCEHTNEQKFLMNDGYREIPGDDVYHYYIKYYQIRCADCQTILETQTEESTKEKHDYGYSSQGIKRCSNCGHEANSVCEHANKQQIYLDDTYESIAGDDVYHNHITYYQTRCADCQEILVSQYEDVQKEKHTLDSDGNCSVCHYSASTEQPGKLPDPVVKVKVNGTTAVVTWDAIDGAVRYVYSLRNLTNTTEPAIEHAPVDGLSITLNNLEPESEYRVAIGAVPAGVTDTTVDKDKCSWGRETFTIPAEGKLPDPVVKVTVNGTTAVVTWDAIDGAERYIYSLRNLDTDKSIADHAAVSGLSVTLNDLEPGTQYKIAIAAVPAGVSDTHADREKCSWGEKTFTIPAEGKLPDPVVKVTVNGTTAVVTWDAIDGAERYIYSLRNLNTDESIADHAAVNGLSVTLNNLDPDTQYRVSIGAVPDGVTDTVTEHKKCSWGTATFEIVRLAKPDVTVVVDGAKMIASWEDVPGAVRYVFSLRKTSEPNGDPLYNHVGTNGCSITLDLEPGVEYRLAVAAVPAGVEDTKAETNKCTWALVTFTTETLEEINTPKVLKVETDMKANFLLPGEEVTIKVTCNKATKYLDVYDPAYRTLKDPEFNKEGYPYFEYIVSYAAVGKVELRFIALDEQLEWSRKKEHQGFLDIIVCDHTTTPKLISTSNATKKDRNVHTVTETYEDACLCGKVSNTWSKEVDKPHTWGALQASKTHTQGKGHRRFYECTACHQVKDADYISFLVGKDNAKKCSTCWARYELIRELQKLLSERGYSVGDFGFDGIFGNDTKNAMNAFRKDVMKLGPIDDVDEATMAALRNGISPITSTSIHWSMSRLDRTVNIKVEATSGRLVKGEYYLLVSNDGGNTYARNRLFLVSGGETSVEHTFDIYRDLKLTDGQFYHVATAPLGWKGDYAFPIGTIDLRDKTGFITSPSDGEPIAFFNTGALTVLWKEQSGCSEYVVELLEDGKQIFSRPTDDTYMLIKLSDIKSYTKEDWYVNHEIQINVTSID